MNIFKCLILSVIVIFSVFCPGYSQENTNKVKVIVSIIPQEFFVKRIGGNKVQVNVLVTPGNSPATYQPTPRQMIALSNADIYFRIGVPFENALMPKIKNNFQNLKIIDTRKGITLREMKAHHHHEGKAEEHEENHHDEDNEEHNHHEHAGKDPHIWLSPGLVKIQAKTIADSLCQKDPESKSFYQKNLKSFIDELDSLHKHLQNTLKAYKGKTLMVFHPSWGYFADAYGLKQQSIEIEGKEPGAKQLARIITESKNKNIRFIFVQPQFSKKVAKSVADAIGAVVIPIDPLSGDYINNIESVANIVKTSLEKQH